MVERPEEVHMARLGLRLDDAAHRELRARVQGLLEEYAARAPEPDGTPYSLFYVLHEDPTRRRRA